MDRWQEIIELLRTINNEDDFITEIMKLIPDLEFDDDDFDLDKRVGQLMAHELDKIKIAQIVWSDRENLLNKLREDKLKRILLIKKDL